MDTKTLDQEKFDTLKELADLQSNISNGRSDLIKLKETTGEYMVLREKEAEERVIKVLKESREVLEEINKNHNELTGYNRELEAYAIELKSITSDIISLFGDFNKRMDEADVNMEGHQKGVNEALKNIKLQRVHVQEDRKMLERERQETNEKAKIVMDREAMLERGFKELKKLKVNK